MSSLSVIPSVNKVLANSKILKLIKVIGEDKTKIIIRAKLDKIRQDLLSGKDYTEDDIINDIIVSLSSHRAEELKPIINGTGVLLHTNLGRALFDKKVLERSCVVLSNYLNIEFDLTKGKRGERGSYLKNIICSLTGAEASLVVNNNASAVFLVLSEIAKDKEVIVSRGELVEIGGSFRVPDIMQESGAILKEVGTTNKTKISDYANNANSNTALLMKVHKSNFYQEGFITEVSISEINKVAKKFNIPSYYDVGAALLKPLPKSSFGWEESIKEIIEIGTDLVSFSGDKLLGGPQAGIIVGKQELIDRLKRNPLYRVLRVGKLTETVLYETLKEHLLPEKDMAIPLFKMINQDTHQLEFKANKLVSMLDVTSSIITTNARVGGGTLPQKKISSSAIQIAETESSNVKAFHELLKLDKPILSYLKDGKLVLDVIAVDVVDLEYIASMINNIYNGL